jgi:uncharacterized protein
MTHSGTLLVPRSAYEVFELLANPESFAPLLPDFESMSLEDATHFAIRIVMALGQINGHANLSMELRQALSPAEVEYTGQGVVAGSQLDLTIRFHITPLEGMTRVNWQGEFSLGGMLAMMGGGLIESMGRKNFERMAGRIQDRLRLEGRIADTFPHPPPEA